MSEDWKRSNARCYLTFSFDMRKLKSDLSKKVDNITKYPMRKNLTLYKQLLEVLGECLDKYVPYDTGKLARFYTDSKNGLMYKRIGQTDGFNIAEYQYNVEDLDHSHKPRVKEYKYGPSKRYPKGRTVKITLNKGKRVIHPHATDHWADKEHQSKIWPRFTQRAKPLIVAAIRKEMKGKK